MLCFECNQPAAHDHHVVPKSRGGTKTVPLCLACHGKAHFRNGSMASGELTREGIQRARERGVLIGAQNPQCRSLTPAARARGTEVMRERARHFHADVLPEMRALRAAGRTYQGIADELNRQGHKSRRGNPWGEVQVWRCLARAAARDGQRPEPGPEMAHGFHAWN
jgi:hypothetical protein